MRRTGRTPIDDDAEKTEIRPLEASMPLSIMGTLVLNFDALGHQFSKQDIYLVSISTNGAIIPISYFLSGTFTSIIRNICEYF